MQDRPQGAGRSRRSYLEWTPSLSFVDRWAALAGEIGLAAATFAAAALLASPAQAGVVLQQPELKKVRKAGVGRAVAPRLLAARCWVTFKEQGCEDRDGLQGPIGPGRAARVQGTWTCRMDLHGEGVGLGP